MIKKTINVEIHSHIGRDAIFNRPVVDAIKVLQDLVDTYGESVAICTYDWDGDTELLPSYSREETDGEVAIRLHNERQRREEKKALAKAIAEANARSVEADLKELARLKKIYENC